MNRLMAFIIAALFWVGNVSAQYLEPEQAFRARAVQLDDGRVRISWDIARDYKLYRHAFSVRAASSITGLRLEMPDGTASYDTLLAREVSYFENAVDATVQFDKSAQGFHLEINWQGCTTGFCYNPQVAYLRVDPGNVGARVLSDTVSAEPDGVLVMATPVSPGRSVDSRSLSSAGSPLSADESTDAVASILSSGNLFSIAMAFLAFGVLLSFTPCVLPMIPVLSAIIVGRGGSSTQPVTRRRGFTLALMYSLGVVLVYTGMGVAAGLAGEGLGAFLQQPWVLIVFSLLLAAMALSMFDVFELQMPSSIQNYFNRQSNRFSGGRYLNVFLMGSLSSLIIGPCVAAPLAGALLYISQTRDVLTGGLALGMMACGMSLPLLLTGLSAGSLLPRVGAWMVDVKRVFGVLLLAVALWMVNPLIVGSLSLIAWGTLLMFAAFLTPLFCARTDSEPLRRVAGRVVGALLLTVGLAEVLGGLMGNSDPVAPIRLAAMASNDATLTHPKFERVTDLKQLEREIALSTKPVMLDFYADWCVACIEMERFTFNNSAVSARMRNMRLLQVDVTRNSQEDRAIMRKLKVFGPPAMFFFEPGGREIRDGRLVGFMPSDRFNAHLQRLFPQL